MKAGELLDQVRTASPKSSVTEIERFLESTLATDFENELYARIEQMRDFNESCGSKEYLETRGGIKSLRLTMNVFEDILNNRTSDINSQSTPGRKESDGK